MSKQYKSPVDGSVLQVLPGSETRYRDRATGSEYSEAYAKDNFKEVTYETKEDAEAKAAKEAEKARKAQEKADAKAAKEAEAAQKKADKEAKAAEKSGATGPVDDKETDDKTKESGAAESGAKED